MNSETGSPNLAGITNSLLHVSHTESVTFKSKRGCGLLPIPSISLLHIGFEQYFFFILLLFLNFAEANQS